MIIGNGLLANSFKDIDNDDIILFCSGVSNSEEKNESEFNREIDLLYGLKELCKYKKIIYFSTTSVCDKSDDRPYIIHKRKIEKYLGNNNLIIRLSQVIGEGGNKNNLIPFIANKLLKNEKIIIKENAKRCILDVDDVKMVVGSLIHKTGTINFSNIEIVSSIELVYMMSEILNTHKNIDIIKSESNYIPNNDDCVNNLIYKIDKKDYTRKTIIKYYENSRNK